MRNELVSVLIPCYQQGQFLKDCINSLIAQTYTNWEGIIINDGSTDETDLYSKELIQKDKRIIYIKRDNGGVSAARNTGLSFAKGSYIQFLDPDDILERNKLSHQVKFLKENRLIDAVYGNALYFSDNFPSTLRHTFKSTESDHNWIEESAVDKRPLTQKILEKNIFPICSPIFRKAFIDQIGKFDEALSHHEDWDYFLRAANCGMRLAFAPEIDSGVLIRTHSMSLSQNRIAMAKSMMTIRLRVHHSLADFTCRRINLTNMTGLLTLAGSEDIKYYKNSIYLVCASFFEKLFAFSLFQISYGGPFFFVIKRMVPLFPLPLLRFLGISRSAAQALKSVK